MSDTNTPRATSDSQPAKPEEVDLETKTEEDGTPVENPSG
jgi:hypothetical protein